MVFMGDNPLITDSIMHFFSAVGLLMSLFDMNGRVYDILWESCEQISAKIDVKRDRKPDRRKPLSDF